MVKEKIEKTTKKREVKKKIVKETVKKKKIVSKEVTKEKAKPKLSRFLETIGKRKTAKARVRIWTQGKKDFLVNEKSCKDYFPGLELQKIIESPLKEMNCLDQFKISVKIKGGGFHSQAEALRHGLSKALVLFNPTFRKKLKKRGFLTRDSRMRERKKFGLKRARRAPQWSKR